MSNSVSSRNQPLLARVLRGMSVFVALGLAWLASASAQAFFTQPSLKVATYNIHHGVGVDEALDLARIAELLAATDVEVIALQEVDRHWSERSDFADQASELAELLGMYVVYGANLDNDPLEPGQPRRQYGTALLSSHPIVRSSNIALPNLGGEQRGLLVAEIVVRGTPVTLLNTHLQHNNQAERAAQSQAIAEYVAQERGPVVLLGDLNAVPTAPELDALQAELDDAWVLGAEGAGYTYPAEQPDRRIDYVLVSPCVDAEQAEVISTLASDHLPVVAALRLPSPLSARACHKVERSIPLARAHAHNDYEHERPLADALAHGFTSVEADVWLVDGELRVAHDLVDAVPGRTLDSLYLRPLLERVLRQGGSVHRDWPHSFQLLIDIKSEAEPTYRAVHAALARYPLLFTSFTQQSERERAVTAVISGNRPRELMANQRLRFAGYDGRSDDLGGGAPASFIPLISNNWTLLFTWLGEGAMPDDQRAKLHAYVAEAHANGQRVRFWATPETQGAREAVWAELIAAQVDYINTDYLDALKHFLLEVDPRPRVPHPLP